MNSTSHEEAAAPLEPIHEPLCIELTGNEHRWRAEYRETDGLIAGNAPGATGPDLHVPVGTNVVLILNSEDYIYMLAIPEYGLKEIAVPGMEFRMEFRPMQAGQYPLIGEELCGLPGQDGPGRLIVEPPAVYQAWLRRSLQHSNVHTQQED